MGTNYYAVPRKLSIQPEVLHIGKASAGWKFGFQGYTDGEHELKSYDDWINYIRDNNIAILDEYDREISLEDFMQLVADFQDNENPDNFIHNVNVGGYRFYFNDFC